MSSLTAALSAPEPTLRIAYFGLPLGALALAKAGFAPMVLCLGHPDARGARRVRRMLAPKALVLGKPDLSDPAVTRAIASARPEVIVSWFWPKRIPESVLALAPRGAFGAHPSLLPKLRGPDPYFWAIFRGERETGVTLHRLEAEYDTGAIVAARRVPIHESDDAWTLAKRLDRPGLELIVECVRRLAAGEALEGVPQEERLASEAKEPDADLLTIDWHAPAGDIVRLVRAAAPFPGASAELDGAWVEVIGADVFERELPRALEPADAVLAPEGVVIRAGEAGVLLRRVRTEAGLVLAGSDVSDLFAGELFRMPFTSGRSTPSIRPQLLQADNFTPPSRTPWGGTRLVASYKPQDALSERARSYERVGESWEISVEPDFPSLLHDGTSFAAWLAAHPEATLGEEHRRGRTGTALLVKLIDTSEPLSVQIHPSDDFPRLAVGECGKPESWYVVDREPGSGLYLGFQPGTSEGDVRAALEGKRSLRELLRFVPVEPGDFFVIDAGTPHAIGAGLTLVEPQHVVPGLRGITYRYWDWDRRYDREGRKDPAGEPRPLHAEHALATTAWSRVQADEFVTQIRVRAGQPSPEGPVRLEPLCGALGGLPNAWLNVARLSGTGTLALPRLDRLVGITVLSGTVTLGSLTVERGRSAVVPACASGMNATLTQAHVIASAVG